MVYFVLLRDTLRKSPSDTSPAIKKLDDIISSEEDEITDYETRQGKTREQISARIKFISDGMQSEAHDMNGLYDRWNSFCVRSAARPFDRWNELLAGKVCTSDYHCK
jgi:hypothetical protein